MVGSGLFKKGACSFAVSAALLLSVDCRPSDRTRTKETVSEKTEIPTAVRERRPKPSRFYAGGPSSLLKIEAAERQGKIDAEKALLYRFYSILDPGKLPAEYRSRSPIPCGSPVFRDFRRAEGGLSAETS